MFEKLSLLPTPLDILSDPASQIVIGIFLFLLIAEELFPGRPLPRIRFWRVFHQMHHSAERVDTYGAFFFSPMDMIGFTFLTSLAMVVVAGFTPQATIYAIYGATFLAVIQHANIRTPQWMGYIFQRPESHSLHHAKGVHAYNYSDLPLFDILFGTFRNPKSFSAETGFYNGASSRMGEMICFKDINTPVAGEGQAGT